MGFWDGIQVEAPPPVSPFKGMFIIPQLVQLFLNYYGTSATNFPYFSSLYYHRLHKNALLALSMDFDALRHAVVAFSALIYANKVNSAARTPAFFFYAIALKQLRFALNKIPIGAKNCHAALATALQLAEFEVIPFLLAR